uniref:Putative secreted protein n=1 Tax=Anopheles marajoara TaxID=58244 RepID=A0A2M4CCX8_9DIPT
MMGTPWDKFMMIICFRLRESTFCLSNVVRLCSSLSPVRSHEHGKPHPRRISSVDMCRDVNFVYLAKAKALWNSVH